ncbi:MAG TPA: response regulator [Candidatus Omnitrophota bacterium]|nr:response regulator [Candidatus Omnitrophota bacterium]
MIAMIGQGLKMVVLDDEKDIGHFIKEFFTRRGFDVHTALTARSAMGLVKKIKPDIALLDIRLSKGKMDGVDVLKFIKKKQPHCCCVMVSYLDDDKLIRELKKIGIKDYLIKPLTFHKIERVIKKITAKIRKRKK